MPISRPSQINPGSVRNARCRASNACRTAGKTAILGGFLAYFLGSQKLGNFFAFQLYPVQGVAVDGNKSYRQNLGPLGLAKALVRAKGPCVRRRPPERGNKTRCQESATPNDEPKTGLPCPCLFHWGHRWLPQECLRLSPTPYELPHKLYQFVHRLLGHGIVKTRADPPRYSMASQISKPVFGCFLEKLIF